MKQVYFVPGQGSHVIGNDGRARPSNYVENDIDRMDRVPVDSLAAGREIVMHTTVAEFGVPLGQSGWGNGAYQVVEEEQRKVVGLGEDNILDE